MSTYLLPKLSSSFSSFSTKSSFPLAIEEEEDEEDEPVPQNFKNQPKERQSWLFKGIRSMRQSLNFGSTSPFAQESHVSSFLSAEKELHIEGVQFGKPLASPTRAKWFPHILRRSNSAGTIHGKNPFLPVLVVACVQRLQLDLKVEGLFRLCGEGAQVSRLREAWEIGGSLSNLSELLMHEPPHNVAALLVQYLCLLPEPLLPTRLFWDFLRIGKKTQGGNIVSPQLIQRVRRLIAKIPTEHRALLSYLIAFLVSVAAHEKINRMTARNLSLVFGPVLMRWPKNVNDITLLKVQANVIELLISQHDVIFAQTDSSLNGTLDQIHDLERRGENDRLPFASSGFASSFFGEDVFELEA